MSTFVEHLSRNFHYAFRALGRSPAFALTAILTLALAIGANSAVFSAINATLLRPLPFPDSDRLMHVMQEHQIAGETNIAPVRLEEWNEQSTTFDAITGYVAEDVADTTGDLPERVRWAGVAPRFLQVWGISPALGRTFTDAEYGSRSSVVLISDRYWRQRFGGSSDVLEKSVRIGDRSLAIVGVLPPSFLFPDDAVDLWYPNFVGYSFAQRRDRTFYEGIGRLKPGVTAEQAHADLGVVQTRLRDQYPDTDRDIGATVRPLQDELVGGFGRSLWLLLGVVSVLLLIACTNIASLLLSRATRREQEMAIRCSLGATRAALVIQMLMETAVLVFAGALLGVVVAAATSAAVRFLPGGLPHVNAVITDKRVFLYTLGVAVAVTLFCGLLTTLRSVRSDTSLTRASHAAISSRHSIQWWLVGVQVALSVTLLAGAGLMLRSFQQLSRVDPGFDAGNVLTFHISAASSEAAQYEGVIQRINNTLAELTALPGVAAAATAYMLPGVPNERQVELEVAEGRAATEPTMVAEWRMVSPTYFETLRMPLVLGEACRGPADNAARRSMVEAMVNQSFARRYFPDRLVVGLNFAFREPSAPAARIVGVVGDARERGFDRDPIPTVYTCDSAPTPFPWYLMRTQGDPLAFAGTIRAKLGELEPLRAVYDLSSLEEQIGDAYTQNRLRMLLLSIFAVTALCLSCLGIFGTLSYVVSLRKREIAMRIALGAQPSNVIRHFVFKALRVVGLACLAGLLLSLALRRTVSGMLYGVTASDPITLSSVVLIVVAVAALAALLPAMRAASVDPTRVLRED